jgi:ABC-type glycerol-3-phosphate transport system substrate-binding protein
MKELFFAMMLAVLIIAGCGNSELKEKEKLGFVKKGSLIAQQTFKKLSSQLKQTIEEKGPAGAIGFCNITAIPLTDEISTKNKATIKRATDKPRNPVNLANDEEIMIIERMKTEMAAGNQPMPVVQKDADGNPHFYAPIILKGLCLQCHGNDSDITADTKEKIKTLYPDDKATGYKTGELRGIWSITFSE